VASPRVGRILLESERAARTANEAASGLPGEILRSAFAISDKHVLTAWHCVREAATRGEGLWFRLRDAQGPAGRRYQYLPLRVLAQDDALDIAVLCLENARLSAAGLSAAAAAQILAQAVIPLGADIAVYEQARVMGFPANASSADSDTLPVTVIDVALNFGEVTGVKLVGESFGAVDPVNPRGLSGGPVLKRAAEGSEAEVAACVVRQVPKGHYKDTSLGAAVIATRIADAALRLPQVAVALRASQAAALADEGDRLRRKGRVTEPETAYRAALAADPSSARAHAGLGDVLTERWRFEEAETACREAIGLDPSLPMAYVALAGVLRRQDRLDDAEATSRKAIRLDPGCSRAYCALGLVLLDLERLAEAETAYRQALRDDPSLARAHADLGLVLLERDQAGAAEDACRKAMWLEPGDAHSYCNLAAVLIIRNRWAEAEYAYRHAIAVDPSSALAHSNLGALLIAGKRYQEAEAASREATRLAPALASAHLNLARALNGLNRQQEGNAAALRAGQLDPLLSLQLSPRRRQAFRKTSEGINEALFGG